MSTTTITTVSVTITTTATINASSGSRSTPGSSASASSTSTTESNSTASPATIPVSTSSTFSSGALLSTSPQSTSSTSAPSSQPSSTQPVSFNSTSSNPEFSPGTVAGISIGTFFAGVLLALLCFCLFLMLRKKKHRSYDSAGRGRRYRDSEHSQEYGTQMKQMTSTVQPLGARNDISIDRILLEPVSSSDIKTDMLAIGSQIVQHVDNNYHLNTVDSLPANFTESLVREHYSALTGISIEQLGKLLRDVRTRRAAIRHLISYFIFSRIILTSDVESSLLPGHIIAFLRQMPPPERTSGSKEAFNKALSQWRLLSAYLLQSVRSNRNPLLPRESDIQAAIARNVTAVRQVLTFFVAPSAEKRQAENLQGLMAEGAKFGLLLFQQPESWVVDWEIPNPKHADPKTQGGGRGKVAAIVLFPGLIKRVDEEVRSVLQAEVLYL